MGTFSNIMSNFNWTGPGMQPVYSPNPTDADRQEYNRVQRKRAYFDGIKGMAAGTRADWEKKYLKELTGKSPTQRDEFYRNTVFKELFRGSEDPEKQKIWGNRYNMSFRQRDIHVAREIAEDYIKKGGPGRGQPDIALNRQAMNLLNYESERQVDRYKEYLHSLNGSDKQNMLKGLDEISNATSPYYKKYNGTDKLKLSDEDKINLAAKFQAWNNVGGSSFAKKALGEYYQNAVANNQSLWEKTINSGAQFIDSATGMLIRAAGMLGAMSTVGKEEGEDYWENVIDNEVTRYGDRVATTNSYDPEEQKRLEKLGLSDNPILNTTAQQESMLSLNTPFELLGQYGFTTASTILSFGGSEVVNALTKGAAWATKAATASKGLNTTARGVKFLRGLSRAKDIGNFAVVGGIATVEGGMNAAQTKHDVLDKLNTDIDDRYRQKAQEDIADQVRKDPQGAARLLKAKGYDIPNNKQGVNQMIELLQNDEDTISAALQRYSKSISDDRVAAEKSANTAMYSDFIGNSVINGFIHSTLQSTLNSSSIQNTLRKYNLAKSPLDRAGIDVTSQGSKWAANARRYSRLNAFGDRLKESLGEGLEEYKQDLSSAYAKGYSEDKYRQYLNNRYAGGSMEDALDNDIVSSMAAGFKAVGETALSTEAIKDGLYGGLSTFMGGLNINSHILNGTRAGNKKEGESFLSYMGRKSPIGWRSGIGPLINSSEADAVNARREEIAKNVNDFFSRPENQEAFFNVNGTSEWMRQLETAAENKDQMEVRNAKLGVLFSNVVTLNSLRGTGYYDAAIASLQSRANLSEENLQDENSEESKLVAMYKQDALNRGQDITDEEALQSIKSSASKMLDTIDKVDKETKEVEKLYGDELDDDVKAGLVFQRLSIEDEKDRINQLNSELKSVEAALIEESDGNTEQKNQVLNRPAKTLMARFGSLDRATVELKELEEDRQKLKESLKSIKLDQKSATDDEKRELALARKMSEYSLERIEREYRELKSLIDNYTSWASTGVDAYGNQSPANQHTISALDIMRLDAQSRAIMLNPNNRENYSQEQQAEIDKVNRVGVQTYQDFASKIQDSSRLTFSYEASMQRQLDMMQNPQLFTGEANRIKSKAQERLLKKKYNYLLDIEEQGDYTTFARELDKVSDSGDRVAVNAAMGLLKDSSSKFLERYADERERLGSLYSELEKGQIENYNGLNDNQKSVFADTLRYLSNKGIDINDSDAAVAALAEQDEEGNSLLEQYINDVNSNVPDDIKSVFTSTEEAIQAYKNVMGEYNSALQEKANNAKETPVTSTTSEQSAPPKTPSAKGPSLLEMGTSTAEESARRSQAANQEGVVEDPITEAYKENSGQEIANLSKLASSSISNASSTTSNQESKNLALDEVRRLSDVKFDNADDYADALLQSANKLDSQSEEDGDNEGRAASLLRAAAARVRTRADESKRNSEEEKAKNKSLQDRKTNLAERKLANPIRSTVNVNAALMDTIPIAWIRQNYPNSPLVKYYDNHRIEEFLETDFMSSKPTVMFISDPQLAESVKADMESRNLEYNEDNIPLIAVVEVPTGGITIKVNGVDKHFQPIGIMPKTGNANSSGSNRLAAIRSLINSQEPGQLIKDADGNIVTTTIGGNVIAEAPKQLPVTEPNRSAISLQINDLNEKEKKELQALSKPDRRKNPIYWRIKQAFLKKLAIATPEGKGKYLYYALPNLKGQVIDVRVFTTPVNLTRDRNSNRLISELFNSNEVSAALNSNSRISRAAKELRRFFEKSFDTSEMYFEADDAGNIVPTESTANKLNALSEQLTKSIGKFLSLPTRDGWKYVISPTSEVMEDGRRLFSLSLVNSEGSQIELGKVTNGQMTENTQFSILKNLIMDGSSVRMVNNRESFVKWNVPYSDVQNMDSNKAAKDNISDIYDDGILEFSKDSLRYHVKGLSINSPFTMQGETNYTKQDEVSSPTNAQPITPLNQPVVAANDQVTTPKGTIVDSESGAVLEGEGTSPTQSSTDVNPIVDSIVANSKIIQLSEDGKHYINTRTGRKYARVTSIIQADEHSDGRFERFTLTKEGINLKNKFESVKKIYRETDGTYQELADKIFDLCAKIGINIKSVTPTELGAPKGFEDDYNVIGDFHLESLSIRINKQAREIAENARIPLGQVLLHESIHAVTAYAILNKNNLSKEAQDAVTTIEAVYTKLKEIYPDDYHTYMDNNLYGLRNSREMVAELANPKFREVLKKNSLFDKLVDSIKTILEELFNANFVREEETLEDNLLRSIDTLINNFDREAFLDNNAAIVGLRWIRDNLNSVYMKKESFYKLSKTKVGEAVTLKANTSDIANHIESLGYRIGDIAKVTLSGSSSFALVRINKIEGNSITLTPIYPNEAGLEILKKAGIQRAKLVTTHKENPWVTPSTNIGTGIDELVRDFFAGKSALEAKYPNVTRESLEEFVQQLQRLKNSLDAQGLTVVPRDIVATGSIEVTDSDGKKHTIDVAGTLDLLAYDGKGNFYIFDMKTHHSTNVDGKIDKWRRQLTLYKTFLESQYGIKVKSLNIIPIKVEYPTPKGVGNSTNEFTVKEGNQLLLNGKEFTGANPNLGTTIALNPIELNVLFDNLTEEEKSQIKESEASKSEVGTIEKVDTKEEGDSSFVEPMTGLRKTKSKDLRRKKKGKGEAVKKPVERLTPVPAKYQWGKFEGFIDENGDTLWAGETVKSLEKAGYTEESWNQLSDEEMQHELECKGIAAPF